MEIDRRVLNLPTIKRLPDYLNILKQKKEEGEMYISSTNLIDILDINPITVRKDLALLNIKGKQRVGYNVKQLINAIENYLGWDRLDSAFLVGLGSLGTALLGYKGFADNGFNIVAAFDIDQEKVGKTIKGKPVFHIDNLKNLVSRMKISLAVLTTPCEEAQKVASLLVECGIKGIWNFTSIQLDVPDSVVVHNENLNRGLAVFSRKLNQNI